MENITPFSEGWLSVYIPKNQHIWNMENKVVPYIHLPLISREHCLEGIIPLDQLNPIIAKSINLFRPSERSVKRLYNKRTHFLNTSPIPLPTSFVDFMLTEDLEYRVPFKDYEFILASDFEPSKDFNNLYFVKFMEAQNGFPAWFLCTVGDRDACVVATLGGNLERIDPFQLWDAKGNKIDRDRVLKSTFFCAASFEEFMYRFLFEHYLVKGLRLGIPLTNEQRDYIHVYEEMDCFS